MSKNPPFLTAEQIYHRTQLEYIINRYRELPEERFIPLFSEWAEENRYLSEGVTDYPGYFDPETAPHLVQILNDLHPDNPCRIVTSMKSVQSMNTVSVAENGVGAHIRFKIGSILFLTSTKSMAGVRGSANIDTMIDDSGLADYIRPASNRTGRKSKDNALYKEYGGGFKLLMTSYGSTGDLKSNTFHLIVKDELDEAAAEVKGQGDIEGVIEGRTLGLINYKILNISTPSDIATSKIYKNYMNGNQNERFCPCPHCGEKQILVLCKPGDDFGLDHLMEIDKETGESKLVKDSVKYICKHCKEDIYESKKPWMLKNGVWVPKTKNPIDPLHNSYHSSGFIAPALGWDRIISQFLMSKYGRDLEKFKDFTINYLGEPYKAVSKSADWELLKERAEDYCLGEVPVGEIRDISGFTTYCGPMILFSGCDVQKDRLEIMVVGFGPNSEKWVIDYKVFYGTTKDINDPCWLKLQEFVYFQTYKICGTDSVIMNCALDAGYNPGKAEKREKDFNNKSNVIYEFVSKRTEKFMAVMGNPSHKDNLAGVLKESRISDPQSSLKKRYLVSVSLLKEVIMDVVKYSEGFGTIHFPKWQMDQGERIPVPNSFFQGFLSERLEENPKKPGTEHWHKFYERNEPLDTYIYAVACSETLNLSGNTLQGWYGYYRGLVGAE